jgi:hypothetical protein
LGGASTVDDAGGSAVQGAVAVGTSVVPELAAVGASGTGSNGWQALKATVVKVARASSATLLGALLRLIDILQPLMAVKQGVDVLRLTVEPAVELGNYPLLCMK